MKKILSAVIGLMMLMTTFAYAATPKIGDVINKVLATDIVAYIDGRPINSYNIDGNTAVVVEELDKYGFDITWEGTLRILTVRRNLNKEVTGGSYDSSGSHVKVGTAIMDVYYTDIHTYLNGCLCDSYNVGGQTIIFLDDLNTIYGDGYNWNGSDKTISLSLGDTVNLADLPARASQVIPLEPTPVETAPVYRNPVPEPAPAPVAAPAYSNRFGLHEVEPYDASYCCNTNTMKFHRTGCKSINQMSEKNKLYVDNTRTEVISAGFVPCKNCNP